MFIKAHSGIWDKSADGCFEVRGKTLGIVGYGNIGSQLSVLAESCGMRVIYFDIINKLRHGNSTSVDSLDNLLCQSDVVSMHVPETNQTEYMISSEQLLKMKKGSYLINNSRGKVVDLIALTESLNSGHIAGAAIDVFPIEPQSNKFLFENPLQGLSNVILTPHIGGSTMEAQERIGEEVAQKLIDYSDIGSTVGAVNFPQVNLSSKAIGTRYMHVHENTPGILKRVVNVFSGKNINITGQHLQTEGSIGYLVVDVDCAKEESKKILKELKNIQGTIRARLIYERIL